MTSDATVRQRLARIGCALLLGAASTALGASGPADPYARDLLILTDWFEGEFDNEGQVWFERDPLSATPEAARHERLHTLHRRIEAPAFGEHVFYVEEYRDNDPAQIVRQRLVVFRSDPEAGGIRMQQGFFRDGERYLGSYQAPEQLTRLKPRQVQFLSECDVFWRRVAGQFEGRMKEKACVFGDGAKRRYSVHNLWLSQSKYWRVDATYLVSDGSRHVGFPDDEPHQLRRAKRYQCEAQFGAPGSDRQKIEGLSLHSQGGSFTVTRAADGQAFDVLMREKEYPFYSQRPDFIYFSIRRSGEQRSVAYTVNDPRSRSLGVNFDDMLFYCYLEGYAFRERYDALL
ncbi:MAG: chromophore lyase CpcT/CpeT [Pseudomonadota bacterium]